MACHTAVIPGTVATWSEMEFRSMTLTPSIVRVVMQIMDYLLGTHFISIWEKLGSPLESRTNSLPSQGCVCLTANVSFLPFPSLMMEAAAKINWGRAHNKKAPTARASLLLSTLSVNYTVISVPVDSSHG
jgi:hypothetical protein